MISERNHLYIFRTQSNKHKGGNFVSLNRYDLNADSGIQSQLLYISAAKYGEDWLSVPHTHTCTELFYVAGGYGNFLIGNESFPVSKGDLIAINPMVEHTETSVQAAPLEYIVLGVDGLELSFGNEQNRQYQVSHFEPDQMAQIEGYLQSMLQEITARAPGHETVCQGLLNVLIILLMRSYDQSACVLPAANHATKTSAAVRRYIDEHFKEPITLDLLAEVVHVNKYHMAHRFTRDYGISPISYLLQLRLQDSCTLLRSTNHSLSQIAHIVGFSSPSYFSQIFRKSMGMTPSDYRARINQK